MHICSGQQKPKSFLEIQQEQESDFTQRGGSAAVTTPTGNKTFVSSSKVLIRPVKASKLMDSLFCLCYVGIDLEQHC